MPEVLKSLGLYIHIPFCLKKCNYCDFSSYPHMEHLWEPYFEALKAEVRRASMDISDYRVDTVFIGGGTPSLVPYGFVTRLLETVFDAFMVNRQAEITIECNPGTLSEDKLRAYREVSVNRLSIGLQAVQEHLLSYLGRIHTAGQFDEAVKWAQKLGFTNINADLLFGIPHQSLEDWIETLNRVLSHDIAHVSCYSLKIEPDTHFGNLEAQGLFPEVDDFLDRKMYWKAIELLHLNGLQQYELSNFSKPHCPCQHNMNYWIRGDYLGIGAGAHSFLKDRRFANTPDVKAYMQAITNGKPILSEESYISRDEAIKESMMLGFRLKRGVDCSALSARFETDIVKLFEKELALLCKQELVEFEGTMVRLTDKGMDYANQVFMQFV